MSKRPSRVQISSLLLPDFYEGQKFGLVFWAPTMPSSPARPTSETAASTSAASKLPTRRSLPAAASSDGRLGPRRDIRVSDAPTRRIAVQIVVSSVRFEVAMLAIVLFYSVLVFAQLAMDDPEIEKLLGAGGTDITAMHDAFLKVDLCFLVFFTVEIVVKLYGFGAAYLRDLFNLVDAAIVLGSFVITVVAIDIGETDPHPNRNRHRHRHRHRHPHPHPHPHQVRARLAARPCCAHCPYCAWSRWYACCGSCWP